MNTNAKKKKLTEKILDLIFKIDNLGFCNWLVDNDFYKLETAIEYFNEHWNLYADVQTRLEIYNYYASIMDQVQDQLDLNSIPKTNNKIN